MLMENRPSLIQSSDEDFFDRGQELERIPRSSIMQIEYNRVGPRILSTLYFSTVIDVFMTANIFACWLDKNGLF